MVKEIREGFTLIEALPIARWREYRDLKLEAVTVEPLAFSSSVTDISERAEKDWVEEISSASDSTSGKILLFVDKEGRLIAFAGAHEHKNKRFSHNVFLQGLFVKAEYRNMGLGMLLIEKRIEIMSKRNPLLNNVHCEIIVTQTSSIELHKKLDFEVVGRLKSLICVGGTYYDELWMQRLL